MCLQYITVLFLGPKLSINTFVSQYDDNKSQNNNIHCEISLLRPLQIKTTLTIKTTVFVSKHIFQCKWVLLMRPIHY